MKRELIRRALAEAAAHLEADMSWDADLLCQGPLSDEDEEAVREYIATKIVGQLRLRSVRLTGKPKARRRL